MTRMHKAAKSGNLFNRKGGREYMDPNTALLVKVAIKGHPWLYPKDRDRTKLVKTIKMPWLFVSSPEARGKYGLFTLSISISVT